MGEYGTPPIEISEGPVEIERNGRRAKVMFPRDGGSWYHLSKIFDTYNVVLANRAYGIRATDVMQGIVYGNTINETKSQELATRFDFDSIWGTIVNKYVVQALLLRKLLIYGRGMQRRSFLSLYDSINCLELLLENPPGEGEYRVVNQMDEVYDTIELANKVRRVAEKEFGVSVDLERVPNPRVENEENSYEVEHKLLPSLGFRREKTMEDVLVEIFQAVMENKARASKMSSLIYPTVRWNDPGSPEVSRFRMPKKLLYPDFRNQSRITREEMEKQMPFLALETVR